MLRIIQMTGLISGFLSLLVTLFLLVNRPQPIDWILFTVNEDETSAIYKMRADGSQKQQLSPDGVQDTVPQWSPDGKWILFERRTTISASDIYVLRADGSDVHNLSQHSLPDTEANWSPDGESVVYLSNRDGYQQIYRVRRDGSHRENISPDALTWGVPYWSPNGDWIVFEHWLNGLTRYNPVAQTTDIVVDTQFTGAIDHIQWASHGRWLISDHLFGGYIYRINPYTSQFKTVLPPDMIAHLPQVSPDSKQLALVVITDEDDRLIITSTNGTQPRTLATFPRIEQPQFSPDGQWLVFPAQENDNWDIYRIRSDGTHLENITQSTADEREVQWSMSVLLLTWHPLVYLAGASILLVISIGLNHLSSRSS